MVLSGFGYAINLVVLTQIFLKLTGGCCDPEYGKGELFRMGNIIGKSPMYSARGPFNSTLF